MPHFSRRAVLRGGVVAAGGAAGTLLGERAWGWTRPAAVPVDRGYTGMEYESRLINRGQVSTAFFVRTTRPSVALTFDDGPAQNWTPMVLDQLDEVQASATFFMVGAHLQANAHLVAERMDRHEIGNHTWTHADLAEMDAEWNRAVSPSVYPNDTAGQVAAIVKNARPGDIILAHDVGDAQRLVGLKGVADIVRGLRDRGIEPVTVSRLLAMAEPASSA
jgi:peptidoglycan/xylan/chitin deacetylase (PgdA/CDA1 family)